MRKGGLDMRHTYIASDGRFDDLPERANRNIMRSWPRVRKKDVSVDLLTKLKRKEKEKC